MTASVLSPLALQNTTASSRRDTCSSGTARTEVMVDRLTLKCHVDGFAGHIGGTSGAHEHEIRRKMLRTFEISAAGQAASIVDHASSGEPMHKTRPTDRLRTTSTRTSSSAH